MARLSSLTAGQRADRRADLRRPATRALERPSDTEMHRSSVYARADFPDIHRWWRSVAAVPRRVLRVIPGRETVMSMRLAVDIRAPTSPPSPERSADSWRSSRAVHGCSAHRTIVVEAANQPPLRFEITAVPHCWPICKTPAAKSACTEHRRRRCHGPRARRRHVRATDAERVGCP
jgi:hypothetical protein